MAVSYANREILYRGSVTMMYVEITMDSSYATAGEAVNATDFGMGAILGIIPFGALGGFAVEPVRSSDAAWLLKVYAYSSNSNTSIELVSAKNLSTATVRCLIIGR